MKRRHLFEFEDFRWFPATIRNLMTDYLCHVVGQFKLYKPVGPLLERVLQTSDKKTVIDLASGGGGPWPLLAPTLRETVPGLQVLLTDIFPNHGALARIADQVPDVINVHQEPVNALSVPNALTGLRTQFLSLHHFRPSQVQAIFRNAIEAKQPIAIFEFQDRTWVHLLQFAFSPLFVILLTPLIRPFSWKRLFWTYLVPLVPLFIMWDGVVSVLRTYRTEELKALLKDVPENQRYSWEMATTKEGQVTLNYVLGVPREG